MGAEFVRQLARDFPEVEFRFGAKRFSCRKINGGFTVFLGPECENYALLALHELGHALCEHEDYGTDVERLKIEAEAWEKGKEICNSYAEGPEWDEEFVQDKLDTYRDWLHGKSLCKRCGITRYQTEDGKYHCPRCESLAL